MKKKTCISISEKVWLLLRKHPNISEYISELVLRDNQTEEKQKYYKVEF